MRVSVRMRDGSIPVICANREAFSFRAPVSTQFQ